MMAASSSGWRATCVTRVPSVSCRAFCGSAGTCSSSANSTSSQDTDTNTTSFQPRVDTYAEQRRVWNNELNAKRKEWAADFKQRADLKASQVVSERARIETEKAERKARKLIKSAARAVEVAKEEKQRVRQKETGLRRKAVVRAQRDFVAHLRKTAREEELLKASRGWVTSEDLDERIRVALENPRPMY